MKRILFAIVVPCAFAALASRCAAQDTIRFFNRKLGREDTAKAAILEESPGKLRFRVGAQKPEEIAPSDILEITYQPPAGVNGPDWRSPAGKEDRARKEKDPKRKELLLQEALAGYRTLLPRLADAPAQRRHVQYRIAAVLAALAEADPRRTEEAIDALKKFKAGFGDGWQLVPAVKTLARLHEQKGDGAGAQAAYEELAANAAAPQDVRQEASLLVVRYLLRKGQHDEAARKAKAVRAGLTADDPLAMRLQAYLTACDVAAGRLDGAEKQLKALLASGADADAKALARNTLGDYYRARGQNDEAFWEYLWVDVHYNQDREELAKALYYLAKLFADVRKDTQRAREYLDRLCDEKEFGGLDFHKKALAERPASGG